MLSFRPFVIVIIASVSVAIAAPATQPAAPPVATLLEDNAEQLLPLLTNPTGDSGEGHVETTTVFSGKSSVRIVPLQRFSPHIAGWAYKIVERPDAPDEFRYLRYAWKVDGSSGCMLQIMTTRTGTFAIAPATTAAAGEPSSRRISRRRSGRWKRLTCSRTSASAPSMGSR